MAPFSCLHARSKALYIVLMQPRRRKVHPLPAQMQSDLTRGTDETKPPEERQIDTDTRESGNQSLALIEKTPWFFYVPSV